MKKFILEIQVISLLAITVLLQSCISTAELTELPTTSRVYDFEKLSAAEYIEKDLTSRQITSYEYFLSLAAVDDSLLIKTITNTLIGYNYHVKISNPIEGAIVAQRGIKAYEWKTVVGVYFKHAENSIDIYIKVQISQDVTGGWQQDRAMEIGKQICRSLQTCTKAYTIKTIAEERDAAN